MKIGLLTIHHANSYGGMLQAFASQQVLSRFAEVAVLDYRTGHLDDTMRLIGFTPSGRGILRAAKNVARLLPRRRLLRRFRDFQESHLRLTEPLHNIQALAALEDQFDTFVCGSDQIWNPNVIDSFDSAYFLSFVTRGRRISFASSMGSHRYGPAEERVFRECVSKFDAVSVRESDTNEYVRKILGRDDVVTVLDPTLMLDADEWIDALDVQRISKEQPYMLVYALKLDAKGRALIGEVSERLGLPVIAIDQDPFVQYKTSEHKNDAGPREYLALFANAAFVVTDSFHGTAFSINFNVPFISIPPRTGGNRLGSLLGLLGLEERLASDFKAPPFEMSFANANERLLHLRAQTFNFLSQVFSYGTRAV